MKVVFISDTHNRHHKVVLPKGDVLIHAGDVSGRGTQNEIEDFLKWFSSQPHQHKIFIAGNHDFFIQQQPQEFKEILPSNIVYLQDELVEIDGKKIYGSPWTPRFMNWAFMKEKGEDIAQVWRQIPNEIDVLITHGPAFGTLDKIYTGLPVGCEDLAIELRRIKPRCFLFGHIHEGYGVIERDGITFMNGAVLNERYVLQNEALVFDL
ncbi:MAG: metallophosphatase domain-containing protein [Flavobacteriales bacterium]